MRQRRPSELLYGAVASGMWLYAHSAFRVVLLGGEHLRMRPHLLVVSTHRSDADVPLICAELFFGQDRMWRRHHLRLSFAARDDLFERGAIAGLLPPSTPLTLTRLLFGFDPSPYLPLVRVNPIRGATTLKAVQAIRADPDAPIGEMLPERLVARLARRAQERRLPPPETGAAVLRPEFADLLWSDVEREELPDASALWRRRSQEATADLRRLIDLVRAGEPLLLFPEGEPSTDGSLGPLRRGLGVLVRRARPTALLPIAIAYDPFTRGRPRACLSVAEPFSPPAGDVEEGVLAVLRRVTPLTCGQLVADRLLRAADAEESTLVPSRLDAALAGGVEEARAEGRPVDVPLAATASRRRRLSDCLAALVRLGLVEARGPRTLVLRRDQVRAHAALRRAAREYESARAEGFSPPPGGETLVDAGAST